MIKLIITDLDNTLYDWVSFFSLSFDAMLTELCNITKLDRAKLTLEFKTVHQRYHNSERPYAALELPSLIKHFGTGDRYQLMEYLQPAFSKFKSTAIQTLKLYPNVTETLRRLQAQGIPLVGHTESYDVNSASRMKTLSIKQYYKHLYTLKSETSSHPDPSKPLVHQDDIGWLIQLPREERKPNPKLLLDICEKEGVMPYEALYIGDSIPKDISMANRAGVVSVWASYGRLIEKANWKLLVDITHWTDEDVRREEDLKLAFENEKPMHSIDDFSELIQIVNSYN